MVSKMMEETSMQENDFLIEAATDFGNHGATDKVCPRCGSEIIIVYVENSYVVKCVSDGCIEAYFRGI